MSDLSILNVTNIYTYTWSEREHGYHEVVGSNGPTFYMESKNLSSKWINTTIIKNLQYNGILDMTSIM